MIVHDRPLQVILQTGYANIWYDAFVIGGSMTTNHKTNRVIDATEPFLDDSLAYLEQ